MSYLEPQFPIGLGVAFPEEPTPIRVLTMDGGGIYGYVTALMLRWLCEEDEHFLKPLDYTNWSEDQPGAVWAFAGTSAGALNALLLASDENPREVVLSGRLERFWHRRGTFDNSLNPWFAYLSWFGVTGWLGSQDYERELEEIFGDRTMGELPHRIMVTAFNWTGTGLRQPCWCPKVYVNFPNHEPDRELLIRQVAYAAGSPPGFRAIKDGIGDGGIANPDPSAAALLEVVKKVRRDDSDATPAEEIGVMARVRILSLGVCLKATRYGLQNFDFGPMLFSLWPTDPAHGTWMPPIAQLMNDIPTEGAIHTCRVLLEERFHRLDPPLLGPPETPSMLVATAMARFPWVQRYLLERQQLAIQSDIASRAMKDAASFLEHGWEWPTPPDPGTMPSPRKKTSASRKS